MKTKKFTLIELLTVIAIIAVLAGMLIPVLGTIKEKAKKTKARAQMNAITIAIKSYESTYGVLPWDGAAEVIWDGGAGENDDYDTLMEILTCVDGPDAGTVATGNARGIRFLDAPNDFTTNSMIDPWGTRFGLGMDLDYTNVIDLNEDSDEDDVASGGDVASTVIAWSFGPLKDNNKGSNTKPADDIASWKD